MDQAWFEMSDIRRKSFNKSAWIPLRAVQCEQSGQHGNKGYIGNFFRSDCITVPIDKKDFAEALGWMGIGLSPRHSGYYDDDGTYFPADTYIHKNNQGDYFQGNYLVLVQPDIGECPEVWHLHQDIVLTLGLYREGDSWICPEYGYTEVARLKRGNCKQPVLLEMKAEYLKDYLCARNIGLYISSYYGREVIVNNISFIDWKDGEKRDEVQSERWEGDITGLDISLCRILGRFWRSEWVQPSQSSPKIKRDKTPPICFIIDTEGNKVRSDELINTHRWLWFKPDVIMALSNPRGGSLTFDTQNMGSVACSTEYNVTFGMNELGYINVYAEDIGSLPDWQQQIWLAYNITPDGDVSDELLASQDRGEFIDTKAPEKLFCEVIKSLNEVSQQKWGFLLFNPHEIIPELLIKVHRFRATDDASLFALAKDIARLIADSLNTGKIQKIISPLKDEKLGSLKSLEKLLASKIEAEKAKSIMSALVGVYDLRLADAHLPSEEKTTNAFTLVGIDRTKPAVLQACQMLNSCVSSLCEILKILRDWQKT